MPYLILSVIVQIVLIVHVFRTGRPVYWAIIILIAPGIGSLAYFLVELLPSLSSSHRTRKALRGVRKTFDPEGDLRQRQKQLNLSGSVDASRHLAAELVESGRHAEAIEQYESALAGLYEQDPDLLLGLAKAQFGNGEAQNAKATLDRLIEHNPEFKSPDGHLLYARAAEACGDNELARSEYAAVAAYFAGAEARLRYGLLLEKIGEAQQALAQFEDIINAAELAPRHYRRAQKRWILKAKEGISRLGD